MTNDYDYSTRYRYRRWEVAGPAPQIAAEIGSTHSTALRMMLSAAGALLRLLIADASTCPDGLNCGGGTCCKLREPFGYGCTPSGGDVCCADRVHYCPGGFVCNMSEPYPLAGHAASGASMGWGTKGAWGCDPKPGAEGVRERLRAERLRATRRPDSAASPDSQKAGQSDSAASPPQPPFNSTNCNYGTGKRWVTWAVEPPTARCAAGSPGDQKCNPYEMSADLAGLQFNGCAESHGGYYDVGESTWDPTFPKVDLNGGAPGADTWYPYWSSDGRWYSSFTDGTVGGIHSQSGGSNPSMHGQVVLEPHGGQALGSPGNPGDMRMVQAASFAVNTTPFGGNYPTGVFTSNASGQEMYV